MESFMKGILDRKLFRSRKAPRIDPNTGFAILLAAGIGAGAMYLLDPSRGRRRRRLIADKLTSVAHRTSDALGAHGRDLANHARGLAASARRPFRRSDADDAVVSERVRAELGRVVSYPGAIEVDVDDGTVFLWGDVPADEADDLLACAAAVRGVRSVEDRLTRRISAVYGKVPPSNGAISEPPPIL
jgi:hypothetical protein